MPNGTGMEFDHTDWRTRKQLETLETRFEVLVETVGKLTEVVQEMLHQLEKRER